MMRRQTHNINQIWRQLFAVAVTQEVEQLSTSHRIRGLVPGSSCPWMRREPQVTPGQLHDRFVCVNGLMREGGQRRVKTIYIIKFGPNSAEDLLVSLIIIDLKYWWILCFLYEPQFSTLLTGRYSAGDLDSFSLRFVCVCVCIINGQQQVASRSFSTQSNRKKNSPDWTLLR